MPQSCLSADFIGPKHAPSIRITKVADPVDVADATSKQWVQTAIAAAVASGGSPYEASNGWISGGLITFAAGSTQFSVSTVVVRFTAARCP